MVKKSSGVVETVISLAEPIAEVLGLFIWDVEFVKEGARRVLRITIDSEEGVGIEDCEKFHRAIDPALDEADPIEEAYNLEVSSPGIERDLKNDMHIAACCDWDVEVRLFAPLDGAKSFKGVLCPIDEQGNIVIKTDNGEMKFERAKVAKLQTVYNFD